MADDRIQIEGLTQINRALRDIGGKDARKAMAAAHRVTAQMVYDDAKHHIPVGSQKAGKGKGSKHPGRLQKSLRVQAAAHRGSVVLGGKRVPYAPAIHWGWPTRHLKGRRVVWHALGKNQGKIRLEFFKQMDKVLSDYGLNRDNV